MKNLVGALSLLGLLAVPGVASATPTYEYVGSWEVDQATVPDPNDGDWALSFTGQAAAAYLFGGNAANYVISTVDDLAADINFSNWVSTWGAGAGATLQPGTTCGGFPCGQVVADTFNLGDNDVVGGTDYITWGDTSALVHDWAVGSQFTNYAFLVVDNDSNTVPAPESIALLGFGLFGIGGLRRKAQTA